MTSQLAEFTTGQKSFRLSELSNLTQVIRRYSPNMFWRALGYKSGFSCKVVDKISFDLAIESECLLTVIEPFRASSEHLVLLADLHVKTSGNYINIPVIIKFYMRRATNGVCYLQNMDKEHCKSIIKNYNDLHFYLKRLSQPKVSVVPVCIVRGDDDINLWIEKRVDNFTKFVDIKFALRDHSRMIATTTIPELQKLQVDIYLKSGCTRTVCDLQGARDKNGKIILCDIEFTDTLDKFGMKSSLMLEKFKEAEYFPAPAPPQKTIIKEPQDKEQEKKMDHNSIISVTSALIGILFGVIIMIVI
jgi:hypothetical protein